MKHQPRPDSARPRAFVFWQDVIGHPAYIDLCRETMRRNLTDHFELVELDLDSCQEWWPEAKSYFDRCRPSRLGRSASLEARQMALFSDLLRLELLGRYGGIWVDADTIVFPRGETIAELAQRDFFCTESELNTLGNGLIGGRAGSPFLDDLRGRMHDAMRSRTEPVVWGEFGFRLIKQAVAARTVVDPADDLYVVPFGHMLQFLSPDSQNEGHATISAGTFSSASSYDDLVPSDAIAMCMFNNSTAEDERNQSRESLLAGDTMLAEAYRRAMREEPSRAGLVESQNRAVFSIHLIQRDLETADRLRDLRSRLEERKAVAKDLRTRLADARERNKSLRERIASLRERNNRLRHRVTQMRDTNSANAPEGDGAAHRRSVFEDIFQDDIWTQGGSKSGAGSSLRQTERLRASLPVFLREHRITSLLDLPCGDFHWMQHIDLGDIDYIGADVVPALIEADRAQFPGIDFRVLDLVSDPLPSSDCVMVRDCFSHLSFDDIHLALDNIRRSGITYLLVTHFADEVENADINTGQFHRLNFRHAPFGFAEPLGILVEEHPNPRHADKCLALWRVSDLPSWGGA